ncbi:MAG: ROK family transcriptional regulator [Propionibacteriaceae bacterium]|nr:ROK family transcriptional regulator [Propionibacteriaceae bacterium]
MDQAARHTRVIPTDSMIRAGQRSLREHNLRLVFSQICSSEAISRADLAETTGLTKATVSTLVGDLIAASLIVELPATTPVKAGRPAIPLTLARGTVASIGLEINVDYLGVRALDLTGDILAESFVRANLHNSDPVSAFATLIDEVMEVITDLSKRLIRILGACLALPGIADHPRGPLRLAPNLGWHDLDIHSTMASVIDSLDVDPSIDASTFACVRQILVDDLLVDNEASLAAQAEIATQTHPSFIYLSGDVGIGSAIVVDGRVFTGVHGWAGEIGHLTVDPHGPPCACTARGCLEVYAGTRSIMTNAGLDPDGQIDTLIKAHQAGDPRAIEALDHAGFALGVALSTAMNIIDVSHVILGGSFVPLAEILTPRISTEINSRVLASRWLASELEVRPSRSGRYGAATGGALAVLSSAVANPQSQLWA